MAAIPPAAPHAVKLLILVRENLKNWPIAEPRDAPIIIIGPSLPAEPPVPRVIAEVIVFMTAVTGDSVLCSDIAFITSATEWTFDLKSVVISPTASPPIAGIKISFHLAVSCRL